jgi:hypothetical protein
MADDDLKLMMYSLGMSVFDKAADPTGTVAVLISETVKFRDKLKEETGDTLTVSDTKKALEALEGHLGGKPLPKTLTPEQKALAQIWIDRLTVFKS